MRDIQIKSTGNRWADAIIGAVVLVALYLLVAVVVGLIQSILGSAGTAHADDRGYLQQLGDGNPFRTDAGRIAAGYQVCTMIKTGTPPPVIAASYTFEDGWRWVNAAQNNLCPETLK